MTVTIQPSTTEVWLPVVGYEGRYEVSSHGRVKSLERASIRRDGTPLYLKERVRVTKPAANGYHYVSLLDERGGRRVRQVHRLVAEAFFGPPPAPHYEVCHGDGTRTNNHAWNLRWGTRADNIADMVRHGVAPWQGMTHCKRGHILAEPNIVYRMDGGGRRRKRCKACTKAFSIIHRHPDIDLQAKADELYAQIKAEHKAMTSGSNAARCRPTDYDITDEETQ